MSVAMALVFEALGFEKFDDPLSSEPAYRTNFGPFVVEAVVSVNRWFQRGFILSGVINTRRTISSIEAELPKEVTTREEGLALLSYFLAPHIPEAHKRPWLRIGERMKSALPWAQKSATVPSA